MNTDELRRLSSGPLASEKPPGVGMELFRAHCAGDAQTVLTRCKEVMAIVLARDEDRWPTDEEWKSLLPGWFVTACADDDLFEEVADSWVEFSEEKRAQMAVPRPWSVGGWVFWFLPEERQWFWWDASVLDADTVEIVIVVLDVPFAWGALEWLLKAAGAIRIEYVS